MYYNRLPEPTVKSYKDLTSYNNLPQGAKVLVKKPKPHHWIKLQDGWYNTNLAIINIIKVEFNEYPNRAYFKKIIRQIILSIEEKC